MEKAEPRSHALHPCVWAHYSQLPVLVKYTTGMAKEACPLPKRASGPRPHSAGDGRETGNGSSAAPPANDPEACQGARCRHRRAAVQLEGSSASRSGSDNLATAKPRSLGAGDHGRWRVFHRDPEDLGPRVLVNELQAAPKVIVELRQPGCRIVQPLQLTDDDV